jgi:sec-independent protein translocase protein TatB
MEFLGVGPLELLLIIVIALIVMGPRDMAVAARKLGRFLNQLYKSETWRTVMEASRSLRTLPNRLAREAALEELDEIRDDLKKSGEELRDDMQKAGQRISTEYGLPETALQEPPEGESPADEPPDPEADSIGDDPDEAGEAE